MLYSGMKTTPVKSQKSKTLIGCIWQALVKMQYLTFEMMNLIIAILTGRLSL